MKRRLKKFFNNNLCLINCIIFVAFFIFILNGYSLLNSKLNLKGTTKISEEDTWLPKVSFQKTRKLGNIFFYNIIIENTSNFIYKDWKITMYNDENIGFTDMLERRKTF